MCIATAAAIASVGISAGGSIAGGIAQQNAADYQAAVARNNALIAHHNAQYAAEAGAVKTEEAGLKARAEQGAVRAAIGANNIDVNSGSAADVQRSQREIGLLDTANEANKAALQVYGYNVERSSDEAQAHLDSMQGSDALLAGFVGAANSVLSASPNLPDKFAWMNGSGATDASMGI